METKLDVKFEHYMDIQIVTDYFNFNQNDIDLHKMKKCFDIYQKEFNLAEEDFINIDEYYKDFLLFFEKNDFPNFSFPYLKNSLNGFLNDLIMKYENSLYSKYYFFMLLLSNRNIMRNELKVYYLGIVKNNYYGISPHFGYVITKEVMMSDEYNKFAEYLAEWYTKIEMIIFYITILNQNFGVVLDFDEKKYSLENNFDFSIKLFAKKNFLKLASYIFKKTTVDVKLGDLNYDKIILLIMSSFTCGISIKDIFIGGDMKRIGYIVGAFCFNFLIGKLADNMENYSNFLEFNRLEKKIYKKVYEILKLVMISKLDFKYHTEKQNNINNNLTIESEIYPNVEQKIDEMMAYIKKYFEDVNNIDEKSEKKIIEETEEYLDKEEENLKNSVIGTDNHWQFIDLCKK